RLRDGPARRSSGGFPGRRRRHRRGRRRRRSTGRDRCTACRRSKCAYQCTVPARASKGRLQRGTVKPAPFEYHAPTTLDGAVQLLAQLGDEAKVLAGGQSLVPMLNMRLTRFDALVDIGRIEELRRIERTNGTVTLGATVAQCVVERDATIAAGVPLLAKATPLIGHFQIRSRGTVGGSIAHADPAAEYPAVALALDAELEVAGPAGRRTIPAAEFFLGTWMTTIGADEILVAARFPVWGAASGFAVEEVARRHGDFAIAG